MIIYSPTDGDALTNSIPSKPRHCFLMTRLGNNVPTEIKRIRKDITQCCIAAGYTTIDASSKISGRDFLLKIWKQIAASPLAIAVYHEDMPQNTLYNIYYEVGVAQALGKETIIVKSAGIDIPSDFVRTEYIQYDSSFNQNLSDYLTQLDEQAAHYEDMADILENNPVLSLDYLKRAYLITGETRLQEKARAILNQAGLSDRAKNSVEIIGASF
jgi:hypothetical protein